MSAFDVVLPTEIPDKGRVLTGLSRFWFAETAVDRPEPPARGLEPSGMPGRRSRAADAARPDRWSAAAPTVVPIEAVVRGYLAGSGWKEYQANGHGLRHPAARRPARERPAARADLHARDQGGAGRARREHRLRRRWSSCVGARRRRAGPRRGASRCTRYAAAVARAGRDPAGRHEVRVRRRAGDRRADPDRRGADARLVALLGRRDLRARPRPGELRQAVRARLARGASHWDKTAPGRPCRPSRRRHARALRRGLRTHHRRQLRALSPGGRRSPDDAATGSPSTSRPSPASSTRRAGRWRAASATSGSTASAPSASAGASS